MGRSGRTGTRKGGHVPRAIQSRDKPPAGCQPANGFDVAKENSGGSACLIPLCQFSCCPRKLSA